MEEVLHVAICDDVPEQLSLFQAYAKAWAGSKKLPAEFLVCRNADQFFFHWEEKKNTDILLLDIEMPGMSGIDMAKKLRTLGDDVQIIFVTGVPDYVFEGYEVEAVSYVLKPVKREQLFSCLDRAWERLKRQEPVLFVSAAGETAKIKLADICYVESAAHDTLIFCKGQDEPYRSKSGITELAEELVQKGSRFFKLHRSYLVSIPYIRRITKKEVMLENGVMLPIARGKWEELNRKYLEYYRREMRQ